MSAPPIGMISVTPSTKASTSIAKKKLLLLALSTLGSACALYGINLWLPQIVHGMGYSTRATGFVSTIPYIVSMVAMVVWARRSEARGERIGHTALTMFLAASALVVAAVSSNHLVVLVALSLAMAGGLSGIGPFQSLLTSFARGPASASGLALVNTIGTLGGFVGPIIVGLLKGWTGGYGAAMAALGIGQALSALIVLAAGRLIIAIPKSRPSPSS